MHEGKLIIAQVDHSSGEIIGHSIQRLFQMGAWNVQLLQSITKKNRPGYMLFIDLPAELVEKAAVFLASELGIWGYHVLESQHVHFDVSFREKTLRLTAGDRNIIFKIRPKYIAHRGELLSIKVDHDQLVQVQEKLEEWGYSYPLAALRSSIETRLWSGDMAEVITIRVNSDVHDRGDLLAI
ncbi:MAG TPA: DUF111 family protein [Desulfotomaculum sp.]|nr:DUF111 family protein [Desulfotomaculum sp.]